MLELERRGAEVWYARNKTGSKVDLLVYYPDNRRELIQVCADMDSSDVRDRELRGLDDALAENKKSTVHLIVLELERQPGIPDSVHWHTASEWLLAEPSKGD